MIEDDWLNVAPDYEIADIYYHIYLIILFYCQARILKKFLQAISQAGIGWIIQESFFTRDQAEVDHPVVETYAGHIRRINHLTVTCGSDC
jgi:hypothetical protein